MGAKVEMWMKRLAAINHCVVSILVFKQLCHK